MVRFGARRILLASVAAMALPAMPVFAQDAEPGAAATGDEIIVTATRREARLQDVPLSVTAVSGESLAQSGL